MLLEVVILFLGDGGDILVLVDLFIDDFPGFGGTEYCTCVIRTKNIRRRTWRERHRD